MKNPIEKHIEKCPLKNNKIPHKYNNILWKPMKNPSNLPQIPWSSHSNASLAGRRKSSLLSQAEGFGERSNNFLATAGRLTWKFTGDTGWFIYWDFKLGIYWLMNLGITYYL